MSSIIKDLTRIASLSIRSIAALHLFTSSCYEISQTEGASMLPTLQVHNDFCVVDKHYKNGNDIQMGDLIVARKPTQPDSWVCKRITGMPGDVVLLDPSRDNIERLRTNYMDATKKNSAHNIDCTNGDRITDGKGKNEALHGSKLEEFNSRFKELKVEKGWDRDPYDMYIIVPDGHVWVTGDNLSDSVDSRTYSVIPMWLIAGKIIIGMYLPNLMRFKGNYYRWLENTFTDC